VAEQRVVFWDQIESGDNTEYQFAIGVFREPNDPILFVTSERSNPEGAAAALRALGMDPDELGMGEPVAADAGKSHFLCTFDERGHTNLGGSDRWADVTEFEAAAMRIIHERFGVRPELVDESVVRAENEAAVRANIEREFARLSRAMPAHTRPRVRPLIRVDDSPETVAAKDMAKTYLVLLALLLVLFLVVCAIGWIRSR
jgi:hypothetical protein